jgi:hypothetical protein
MTRIPVPAAKAGAAVGKEPQISPQCTRISCHAALDTATCAAFVKESRMKIANATKLNRKSGVAERRDLRFFSNCQSLRVPGIL